MHVCVCVCVCVYVCVCMCVCVYVCVCMCVLQTLLPGVVARGGVNQMARVWGERLTARVNTATV